MDATTMPSITSLVSRLSADFPQFTFSASDTFKWNPTEKIIFYEKSSDDLSALLHELSHALLGHTTYTHDISLLQIEAEAWHLAASQLSDAYQVRVTDDTIQDALATYPAWLHARSVGPHWQTIGIQGTHRFYRSLA